MDIYIGSFPFRASELFQSVNTIALLAWLLLIIAPHWKWTGFLVRSGLVSLFFAILYLILLAPHLPGFNPESFNSLEGVTTLFSKPEFVLIGWIHYLAFDLWVGIWELGDAQKREMPHILLVPCLFFTFMFGPVGLFLYLLIRLIYLKKWLWDLI